MHGIATGVACAAPPPPPRRRRPNVSRCSCASPRPCAGGGRAATLALTELCVERSQRPTRTTSDPGLTRSPASWIVGARAVRKVDPSFPPMAKVTSVIAVPPSAGLLRSALSPKLRCFPRKECRPNPLSLPCGGALPRWWGGTHGGHGNALLLTAAAAAAKPGRSTLDTKKG